MGEVIEHLIEHGHNRNSLINEYTIAQIWLHYTKSIEIRRKQQHEDAILIANCALLANPYAGKEAGNKFKEFLNSLLPKDFRRGLHKQQVSESHSKSQPELHNTFKQMGMDLNVPMKVRKRKPQKPDKPNKPKRPKVPKED